MNPHTDLVALCRLEIDFPVEDFIAVREEGARTLPFMAWRGVGTTATSAGQMVRDPTSIISSGLTNVESRFFIVGVPEFLGPGRPVRARSRSSTCLTR